MVDYKENINNTPAGGNGGCGRGIYTPYRAHQQKERLKNFAQMKKNFNDLRNGILQRKIITSRFA